MSANPNNQNKINMNDLRNSLDLRESGGGGGDRCAASLAGPASFSAAAQADARPKPITITRRINVKIQGSMSDFAQDGQVGVTLSLHARVARLID